MGQYLSEHGHDVRFLAGTPEHDLEDEAVLSLAYREQRILITNDRDFGTLIFLQRRSHRGVIFFRLTVESSRYYNEKMQQILNLYGGELADHYTVVTDTHVRFR